MIDLRIEFPRGTRLDRLIDPRAVEWAEAQALNRTRNNVHKVGLEVVARAMGISVSKLRKRGKMTSRGRSGKFGAMAKDRRATRRRLRTAVIGTGRPWNVTRWNGQVVRVAGRVAGTSHEAYGRRQVAPRTWMLPSKAIVVREGRSFRGVFGPGVGQMMQRRDVLSAMQGEALKRFPRHFSSAVDFAFSRGGSRFLR